MAYDVSERRTCLTFCLARSTIRYRSVADKQVSLRMRIREIAEVRVSWGYPRIWVQLRREGWLVNRKRVYRLYRQEGLCMKQQKPQRHRSSSTRIPPPTADRVNESWSMDFMADELFDGRRFRLLTIVDDFTRESLAVEVGQRLTGAHVVEVLDRIGRVRDLLERIRVDNGTEFTSKRLDQWAYSKRRRDDVQPICPDLADVLRPWLESKPAEVPVFVLPGKLPPMLRADLRRARAWWIKATPDRAERRERRRSEFLRERDSDHRIVDFHALRAR